MSASHPIALRSFAARPALQRSRRGYTPRHLGAQGPHSFPTPPHRHGPRGLGARLLDRVTASPSFASFGVRNFRLYMGAQTFGNTGAWMQRVAQDWLVLELTGSPTAVGITTALQFLPVLLFGLYGGILADRFPKRRIVICTQTSAGLIAATLGVLSLTGHIGVLPVYLMALALGVVTLVDNPARQVLVNEMVGPSRVRNAVSLSSAVFQLGGLIGPGISGLLIGLFGVGPSFVITAACYVPVTAAYFAIRERELTPVSPVARAKGQLREGLRHIAHNRRLLWPIVLVAFVGTFGLNMQVVLTAFVKNVFPTNASGYGLFTSAVALGSLGGALASARMGRTSLRGLVWMAVAFGGTEIAAAAAPERTSFFLLLVAVGAASLIFLTACNAGIQLASPDAVRGRVMSVYLIVCVGGTPVGAPIIGWISEHLGARTALFTAGAIPALAALAVGAYLAYAQGGLARVRPLLRHAG